MPDITELGTGSNYIKSRVVRLPFQDYEVQVQLGPNDQFLGIVGIGIKRDFLTPEQKVSRPRLFNIDELYDYE